MISNRDRAQGSTGIIVGIAAFLVIIVLGFFLLNAFVGYLFEGVSSTEVAIKMDAGKPVAVLDSGNYTDLNPFASLQHVNTSNLEFSVSDNEVLTQDLQRVAVVASGTVSRPGKTNPQTLLQLWSEYSIIYTNDEALVGRPAGKNGKDDAGREGVMQDIGKQAIKVCIGDLNFDKAVVGSARDDVKDCVTKELNTLAQARGLTVKNIVVPNVALQKAIQDSLDARANARFQKDLEVQNGITAAAKADADAARTSGAIRVEAIKAQEQAKQDAITADLTQKYLLANRAVIEQSKANELYTAQQDLEIQRAQAQVALQKAQTAQADTAALAAIYQNNPVYAQQKQAEVWSQAWRATDKVIVPAGTNPTVVLGSGTNQQTVVQTPAR